MFLKINLRPVSLAMSALVLISSFFWGIFFPDYMNNTEKVTEIPGLNEGFVPQGSTKFEDEDIYVICGYTESADASRIYLIGHDETRVIFLNKQNGEVYSGHAGGITVSGDYVYISNAHKLFVLDKKELLNAGDKETLSFTGSVDVPCNSSFCSCDGNRIYVGEYHAKDYETDESHTMKTPDGSEYQALVFGYDVNADEPFGIASSPSVAYSVCDKVQGFAVTPDSKAVLSVSGGMITSKLKKYDINGESDYEFVLNGQSIPLYYLDSFRFEKEMTIPRMSEDLECCNGKILVAFEAGSSKFISRFVPFCEKHQVLINVD